MAGRLTDEQAEAYWRDGFVCVRGLFEAGELEPWLRRTRDLASGTAEPPPAMQLVRDVMVAKGAFTPAAVWPHPGIDMQHLSPAAERALSERRGVVISSQGASTPSFDQRAFVGAPRRIVSVEEPADQHVRFARATMVRAPVQALQFLVWKHACDVVEGGPQRKAALAQFTSSFQPSDASACAPCN